jgi:choice-of-anchor C domain-containing protein
MSTRFLSRLVAMPALLSLLWAATAHANLIVNGSFESGPAPGDAVQLPAGSTAVAAWVVLPSNIDYVGTRWTAAEGGRSIGLNGGSAGGIAQTFETTPTARYSVRFWMAGDPLTTPAVKQLRVSAAGSSADFSVDISGMWAWDPGWNPRVWTFEAQSTTSTLAFSSLDTGDAGPSIDSISVALLTPASAGPRQGPALALSPIAPNPMLDSGWVDFGLPQVGSVCLRVLDVSGHEVAVLATRTLEPGLHHVRWNGHRGNVRAPSGVYFVELRAAGERLVQRVVLLR